MYECVICYSKNSGTFKGPCGHEICGSCFLNIYAESIKSAQKSKCPFCRQAFKHEQTALQKLRDYYEKLDSLDDELRLTVRRLRSSTRILNQLIKASKNLQINMRQNSKNAFNSLK